MAFTLSPIEDIEIPIPDLKGGTITLTVPPLDCMDPTDVKKMNKQLDSVPDDTPTIVHPGKNANALIQHMLAFYNPKAKAAIWNLVPRHIGEINDYWDSKSEMNLGKSEDSTDSSSSKKE